MAFGLSTGTVTCPVAPIGTCRAAFRSALELKDKAVDAQDLLNFRWLLGTTTTTAEFGDPRSTATYQICVYDAGGLVRKASAPAGGLCKGRACWKRTGPTSNPNGFVYRDPLLTPDGTNNVTLKSGATPKPKVLWKAKGALLDDGSLGLVPPVVVEVSNTDTPVCFGQTFVASDITVNTPAQFKATAD